MSEFVITEYEQMRRCRMAQLFGETITEDIVVGEDVETVTGHVKMVRPELAQWPIRWVVTFETTAEAGDQLNKVEAFAGAAE